MREAGVAGEAGSRIREWEDRRADMRESGTGPRTGNMMRDGTEGAAITIAGMKHERGYGAGAVVSLRWWTTRTPSGSRR
jgi:hypothetical protein